MRVNRLTHHLRAHPALWSGFALTAAATAASALALRFSKALLIGWCCGAVLYLILAWRTVQRGTPASMRERAHSFDQGTGFILIVTVFAAVASLTAIVLDLGHVKQEGASVALLSIATLILSWFFVHTVFAFHYAHRYYLDPKCMVFPGADQPDYWDFIYFAMVIGMTAQVSDVTCGGPEMRRLVLVHAVIAFFFNTAVLALGVNLTASAMG